MSVVDLRFAGEVLDIYHWSFKQVIEKETYRRVDRLLLRGVFGRCLWFRI